MLNVERMMKDDRKMSAMTGMNLQAFNALDEVYPEVNPDFRTGY
jgi:hypothetical protein